MSIVLLLHSIESVEDFVRQLTSDTRHSGRTLFDHLKGTYDLLCDDDAEEPVCLAGLCHSIYGTNIFRHESVSVTDVDRIRVASMIGLYAEYLAYIFCSTERPIAFIRAVRQGEPYKLFNRRTHNYFDVSASELRDLLQIESANLREQGSLHLIPKVTAAQALL